MLTNADIAELTDFRRELHRFPEVSGEKCPHLHNPDYDFPDAMIALGAAVPTGDDRHSGIRGAR